MSTTSFAMPGTIGWFGQHEIKLATRDFMRMITAGNPRRRPFILAFSCIAFAFLHLISWAMLAPAIEEGISPDLHTLTMIAATQLMAFSLMLSQALEMVTRAFYARSDLDLILSSPVSVKRHFAVRVATIAISSTLLSLVIFAPALNVLTWYDGMHWLAGYPMFFGLGAIVTTLSLLITVGLFNLIGARKTRLVAQIIAAIVGASFVIGIQIAAISAFGTASRITFLSSDAILGYVPIIGSAWWLPAKALLGDMSALIIYLSCSMLGLVLAIAIFARRFGEKVLVASNFKGVARRSATSGVKFSNQSKAAHLRNKEWRLLLRDHWLVSQSLMQILYLIPPALMLWQGFGNAGMLQIVVVPVLVMAAGQLAGGLAWLAISGEDAPELVATAPVPTSAVIRAKIEAVLGAIAFITLPFILVITWIDPKAGFVAFVMIAVSTISATMIQLWFRSQAKRSNFRRRQTSSKVATVAEAFSSILWAATAGIVSLSFTLAVATASLAILVLCFARMFRPV